MFRSLYSSEDILRMGAGAWTESEDQILRKAYDEQCIGMYFTQYRLATSNASGFFFRKYRSSDPLGCDRPLSGRANQPRCPKALGERTANAIQQGGMDQERR